MDYKTLLILTGHTKGLGKAIFDKFKALGGINIVALSRTRLEINLPEVIQLELDLSDLATLEALLPRIFPKDNFNRYLLINNAGWIGEVKPVGKLHPKGIQGVINVNLLAPMLLTDAFVKTYREDPGEKIICNISSVAASKPLSGWGEYCSSKAGLAMFSRVADEELRKHGFRVFSLAPGIVDTDMQTEIRHADKQDFPALDRFASYKSEGLLRTPEEVAEKIFYLMQNPNLFSETVQDVRNF